MVRIENVTKIYGKFKAIENVSFTVNDGEILAFLGPNGAGKTTTMRIISGFMAPTYGKVYINNVNTLDHSDEVKTMIGYLPEVPPLYPDLTVKEYLTFVAELKKVSKKDIKECVDRAIELTDLKERANTLISFLSKGLRQRTGIAQSIVNKPKLLILDEPTVGLDPIQVVEIRNLIKELANKEKLTVILSTHLLAEASEISKKAVIINNGRIIAEDYIENLTEKKSGGFNLTITVIRNADILKERFLTMSDVIIKSYENNTFSLLLKNDIREEIAKMIIEVNAGLIKFDSEKETLEDVFLKLVS